MLSELPDHPLEIPRGVSEIGGPRRLLSTGQPRTGNLAGRQDIVRGAGQPPKALHHLRAPAIPVGPPRRQFDCFPHRGTQGGWGRRENTNSL